MKASLAALALLAGPAAAQFGNPWKIGAPAPDLRLPTIGGETVALSDFRGQKVLLIEFASW